MSVRDSAEDVDALIPELRLWNNGRGVTAEQWIGMMGKYDFAIGYSVLFWPRFTRFESYVLRHDFSEDSLRGFEKPTPDRQAVEAVMNHLHIVDIHSGEPPPSEAVLRYLGRVLKDIHEVKLRADFPELTFVVHFNDDPGLDPIDYQLTFWQAGD